MLMNSLYVDEDQRDHEQEEFSEIKQSSHETVSGYIVRFKARKIQAEDLGLPQNHIIKPILDKIKDGPKARTYLEAKKEIKTVSKTMVLEVKLFRLFGWL